MLAVNVHGDTLLCVTWGGAAKFSTATEVKPPRRYFTCVTCVEEMGEVLPSS